MSSVITISQPPVIPGDRPSVEPSEGITFAPAPDEDEDLDEFDDPFEDTPLIGNSASPTVSSSSHTESASMVWGTLQKRTKKKKSEISRTESGEEDEDEDEDNAKQKARVGSLEKLQGGLGGKAEGNEKEVTPQEAVDEKERKEREAEKEEEKDKLALHPVKIQPRRRNSRVPEAVIVLKEERVSRLSYGCPVHADNDIGKHFPRLPALCLSAVRTSASRMDYRQG
jgi:hypothetical protein